MVRRIEDRTDGRAVKVDLTKSGRALEAKAAAIQEEMRCRSALDPNAVDDLRMTIHALVDNLLAEQ